ncbi:T9SS type A sorting domain-containing protein [Fulvivirgaceae bacterium BMA10]|uniref:T9SS type A sorting domain-containing protein n=1 Tax=Splendidivirga corallicola TaxID=3051826 RepID=A0ABT8KRJ4_9BACT|nr:T9SS type A sorting domain-containing protein [Fulvivirgaceae bacterium BMA10]
MNNNKRFKVVEQMDFFLPGGKFTLTIKLFVFAAGLLLSVKGFPQDNIPIGSWRSHFSFETATNLALVGQRVYCAAENGFFFLDREENSTTKLSKIDGFSDVAISSLEYDLETNTLIIAYESGNIDLLVDNEITNFNIIKNANLSGSKRINDIFFAGDFAYLATDFGVAVFDPNKIEIRETYSNIGPNGTEARVYSITTYQDSLFLATDLGVMASSLDPTVNRLDFNNWKLFSMSEGIPETSITAIESRDNAIYAGIDADGIYRYDGSNWAKLSFTIDEPIISINRSQDELLVSLETQLLILNENNVFSSVNDPLIELPVAAFKDSNGELWVADRTNGLISNHNGQFQIFKPNGPFSDQAWTLESFDEKVMAVSGGIDENGNPQNNENGFYVFEKGTWTNYNSTGKDGSVMIPQVRDLNSIAYDRINRKTYFASFGYGILEWDQENNFRLIDENTQGSTLINNNPPDRFTQIAGLALDDENNLWIGNNATTNFLHALSSDNSWSGFTISTPSFRFPRQILVPYSGNKWIRLDPNEGGGILVFDDQNNTFKHLNRNQGQGRLPSAIVTDIVEDLDQRVWIGTSEGVVFFQTSFDIIEASSIDDAIRPVFENRFLLIDEFITSLAVDGGNRKWIGTRDGLWLFGESGESLIFRFTEENSPLPSNNIVDIAIESKSGEIFIATDKGLVSFRSTASKGEITHSDVKVFPNPVNKDFTGYVGISGLANNATVKITDISGKLVYETRAQGGTATWDVLDYQRKRASTGVYLILSSTPDGTETYIGKIAVID